eukprot:TRINITY_DN915_c0_g1_i8.p1 TRINITY_DN915_c0_g1~~TRINITY_DN915_c0_g1_i8.p1  ORF type:complete len:1170 (-),score=155.67 TRINITY_DN915_c0_g1_i8:121-3630(-)
MMHSIKHIVVRQPGFSHCRVNLLPTCIGLKGFGRTFSTPAAKPPAIIAEVDYEELVQMTPAAMGALRQAFVGPKAFGGIAIMNVPGYGEFKRKAFRQGIDLALKDSDGRARAAAVNNTYPGWSGTPGAETHPLQSSFLFNVKEEINGAPDPYFGKNIFPSKEYRDAWVDLAFPMHDAALQLLRGCDILMEEKTASMGSGWSATGKSLHSLAVEGPALAGRFICYDSGFTREDSLLHEHQTHASESVIDDSSREANFVGHVGDGLASMRTHSTPVKSVGHAGDGLASMRTHSTPVKSAGHAGDGLASMRTHSTPVKSAGHAGDGLASMRTHSTPVKSAGHAGDSTPVKGLASMRTHSTPVKSAGHAGDGLASMRTHSTPVKSAGHSGDGLASMRTHSTPVKSAGHAGDGLASMRTHSTPVKSAGHAGDGLASMRTHSTPMKSAGHAGEGLVSELTAGHSGDGLGSMRTLSTTVKFAGAARSHSTKTTVRQGDPLPNFSAAPDSQPSINNDLGDYWLPWHIDSNFLTIIHKEMYADEKDASFVPEPDGAGVLFMNADGDIGRLTSRHDDAIIVQMGAFGQIYTGGHITACRHAVATTVPPNTARFNFCNFWYAKWNTVCEAPVGMERTAINTGWNAMMDSSYLNITMRQGFAAFREFMTKPEARMQFASSDVFHELSEVIPMPANSLWSQVKEQNVSPMRLESQIVVDMLTDVRCPFAYLAKLNLEQAAKKMGIEDRILFRFHPVFLNPNVSKEGESLDDYLLRDYGFSKEYAHSKDYPLYQQGLAAGVEFNPMRRVLNTFDAFCLVELAEEQGLQNQVVEELSRRYFEGAQNISDHSVLIAAGEAAGITGDIPSELLSVRLGQRVADKYTKLSQKVQEIPQFLVRDRASGNGVEVNGVRSVTEFENLLRNVLSRSQFFGMRIPGPQGQEVWLAEANPTSPVSHAFPAQHGSIPKVWRFTEEDFERADESDDAAMYAIPRLVDHLDETSCASLQEMYRAVFSAVPHGFAVLDLCSSWTSHFPAELLDGARVVVHGLNQHELDRNVSATENHVQDLNKNAKLPWDDNAFDFVTMALSVQYLTQPREVFSEINRVLKVGGMVVVAFSNRCFIDKTVNVWANEVYDGEGHAHIIHEYLTGSCEDGWSGFASVDVSPRHGDPVWAVTAVKTARAK